MVSVGQQRNESQVAIVRKQHEQTKMLYSLRCWGGCKPTLDKDELSNYRSISNLSLISKIIERVVKSRLSDHLTSNNLVNPHQSAYCKHHSTETALLYIHDHLINAISSRKISCLCLLDLSAAFDTVDHNILLTRLSSWFDIHGTALNWFLKIFIHQKW